MSEEQTKEPRCPELQAAWAFFHDGNFAAAKATARGTVSACPADRAAQIGAEANELLACMTPDPWARRLTIAAALLLAALAINYVA